MPLGREAIHPLSIRAVLTAVQSPRPAFAGIRDELTSDLEGAGLKKAAIAKNLDTFDNLVKATRAGGKMATKKKPAKKINKRAAPAKKTNKRSAAAKKNPGLAKGQSLMQDAAAAYRAGEYDNMAEALHGVAMKKNSRRR